MTLSGLRCMQLTCRCHLGAPCPCLGSGCLRSESVHCPTPDGWPHIMRSVQIHAVKTIASRRGRALESVCAHRARRRFLLQVPPLRYLKSRSVAPPRTVAPRSTAGASCILPPRHCSSNNSATRDRAAATMGAELWVCQACGLQHDATEEPPKSCQLCEDDRQYVGSDVSAAFPLPPRVSQGSV